MLSRRSTNKLSTAWYVIRSLKPYVSHKTLLSLFLLSWVMK
jgi:hypothetical protein